MGLVAFCGGGIGSGLGGLSPLDGTSYVGSSGIGVGRSGIDNGGSRFWYGQIWTQIFGVFS